MSFDLRITGLFGEAAIAAARAHARASYPNESCGYIADGVYYACENHAPNPLTHFILADEVFFARHDAGLVQAVVHSHPQGLIYPSQLDMASQIELGVPFVILPLNENNFGAMSAWGDTLPIEPIIGRPFVHGIFDCYSAVRDVFRLGREELAKQDVDWPFPPIVLPQIARDDEWWKTEDLYRAHLAPVGFREISISEAKPGDGFLVAIGDSRANPHGRLNHAGVLTGNDLLLHHLPNRISRREPTGLWGRAADLWVRYEGPGR